MEHIPVTHMTGAVSWTSHCCVDVEIQAPIFSIQRTVNSLS